MRGKILAVAAIVAGIATGPVHAVEGCAPESAGGEWRSYGRDLFNTRSQPSENLIGPGNVATLEPAWSLDVAADLGGTGNFQSTPAIADGCIYLATDAGWIFSLNAESGAITWTAKLDGGVFGVSVADGKVVALVNRTDNPYGVALDQGTGAILWETPVPQTRPRLRTNASTVVWNDVVFMGYSVVEGDIEGHAGWQVLDLDTGERLAHDYVIPEKDWQYGYGGGGVWTTGAVSPDGFVFVGTSNPTSKKIEHPRHNAVLKIDLNRTLPGGQRNPSFGRVVDSNKGNFDQYYPGLDRQPACEMTGDQILYFGFSATCAQLDLDFGASPNLFHDDEGNLLVGILQKSGVYHAYYADTMHLAWTQVLGPPCLQCNFATTATDGETIYGVGTPPSQMVAFDTHRGGYRWVSPVGDGLHHQAVSVANGVVYTVDSLGNLNAFDAALGVPLLKRPMAIDTGGSNVALSSSGIAIARNTLYAPAGADLVAYRLAG